MHINCWCKKARDTGQRCFTFFLYIINSKKYSTFQLRALCVRARTMHGLEMHLMLCYNEFWIYLHKCSFFKSILLHRVNKSCLLPFLSNLHCTSIKWPTSIKRPLLIQATFNYIFFPYFMIQVGLLAALITCRAHSFFW